MKRLLLTGLLLFTACFISRNAQAQSTTLTPGSILPTMTTTQRAEVLNPPNGMLVFDSNTQSYWFRQSGAWVELPKGGSTSNYWELNGLAGNELKNTNSGGFWSASATTVPSNATDISNPPTAPINGSGTRMMWIPSRSAFRAGTAYGSDWDENNVGLFSVAMGFSPYASGRSSFAIGPNTAAGENSIAMGVGNSSIGQYATSIGVENVSQGNGSFAIGAGNNVELNEAIAIGNENDIHASHSFALGNENTMDSGGSFAVTIGSSNSTSGDYSIAIGDYNAVFGDYSFAFGNNNFVFNGMTLGYSLFNKTSNSVVVGYRNDDSDNPSGTFSSTDRLFQIGNGFNGSKSNALTVLKNGKIGLNNKNLPDSPLHIKGIGSDRFGHLVLERSNSTEFSSVYTNLAGLNFENSLTSMNFNFKNNLGDIKAVINNAGYIGSLVTTPLAPLHLGNGPNTWERHIRLDYDASTNEYGNIVYDDQGMKFRAWGTGDNIYFRNNANTQIATIFNTGNMTIAGTLTQNSDRRFKTNIAKVQNSGTKLAQLQAYHYNWKAADSDPSLQTGLIAQEVQMQFPELVNEGENGHLSVNYIGLIPHLIESHKELKAENEMLKERLQKIEEKLSLDTQTTSIK